MAYNPDPRLVQAIRQNGGKLAPILLATALVESGGRLDAVGDGGRSHGPYQMYDLGRGAGVPIAKRRDPVFSTKAALREFQTFYGRGARGADLAYRAQRPADRAGYIAKISAALPFAQQILGAGAGPAVPPATGTPAPGDLAPVSGSLDVKRLMGILNATSQRALRGEMPGPNYGKELQKLAMGALEGAQVKAAGQQVGAQVAGVAQQVAAAPGAPYNGPLPNIPARNVPFGADPQGDYDWAQDLAKRFGLSLTSGYRNPSQQRATGSRAGMRSRHLVKGGAADISGSPEKMRALAEWAIRSGMFAEVFYDPLGYYWDNGRLNRGGIGGHSDHVHISYGKTIR
jgi:hypothetical protein